MFFGSWRCYDMLLHLCLFLLLVTFSWLKSDYTVFSTNSATIICQQHVCKFVVLRRLCMVCETKKRILTEIRL